jgi:hypothetical protein
VLIEIVDMFRAYRPLGFSGTIGLPLDCLVLHRASRQPIPKE